ncbi:MAG: HIT family protein [Candidatus Paceibacterota bacterium]|jgi:histidine triad (HIT) family protein|nr:HIT family protein [Candidatus Paceibacterota bacterium]MDD4831128.1 HIT family protein [Candidatus Paceibacterota bacterium]MDD4875106.1 HIT family protein [Candidatus Paceibacterota bacterium]
MDDCIFCKIIKGEVPAVKVYEDEKTFAFLELNPLAEGHTLLIPKNHASDIFDIDSEDLKALAAAAKKISLKMKESFKAEGVNLVQRSGKAAEQGVFHFHLHIIPRKAGDNIDMDRWWFEKADAFSIEDLRETAKKIVW